MTGVFRKVSGCEHVMAVVLGWVGTGSPGHAKATRSFQHGLELGAWSSDLQKHLQRRGHFFPVPTPASTKALLSFGQSLLGYSARIS